MLKATEPILELYKEWSMVIASGIFERSRCKPFFDIQ